MNHQRLANEAKDAIIRWWITCSDPNALQSREFVQGLFVIFEETIRRVLALCDAEQQQRQSAS